MVINILNPFKQLLSRLRSFLSTSDDESYQDNFFDALRQTLSEKDFKGSVHEIHPIHSKSVMIKKSVVNLSPQNSEIPVEDLYDSSQDSAWPLNNFKRAMSAPSLPCKNTI